MRIQAIGRISGFIFAAVSAVFVQTANAQNWSGDGGKGKSIAILLPQAIGLTQDQNILPVVVQGELVSNFSTYSAISVLDRANLYEQYKELESGIYNDNAAQALGDLGNLPPTEFIMMGRISKTGTNYNLQLNITKTADKTTTASFSENVGIDEINNLSAIRKASLFLLEKMGVSPTAQAKTSLSGAAQENRVNAQFANAQGVVAQRKGTEVAALSYFFQAAALDNSLSEAANRSSIMEANIKSGNIGNDVRNDIQWRKDWIARLAETERFFDNLNKTESMPYTLFYSSEIKQGTINYQNETVVMSIETFFKSSRGWTIPMERALQAVYDGLNATGRKDTWGLGGWPQRGVTELNAFATRRKNFSVVFELLNDRSKVIGRQTLQASGSWGLNWSGRPTIEISYPDRKTLNFQNVNANDISDRMTIRAASVNEIDAATAARNGVLQILAIGAIDVIGVNIAQTSNTRIINGIECVLVETGTFVRSIGNERREVIIEKDYWISKCPVTQAQYRAVIGTNPSYFKGDNLPVEQVNWDEAVAFCRKVGGRLPTEAEWEFAARGGNNSQGYEYSGSNDINQVAWYSDNSGKTTHTVGTKSPNELGIYDMNGNVWEWCSDWYGDYPNGLVINPTGPDNGSNRVARGGSWNNGSQGCRVANRSYFSPSNRYNKLGLRVAFNSN